VLTLSFVALGSIISGIFALLLGWRLRGLRTRLDTAAAGAA